MPCYTCVLYITVLYTKQQSQSICRIVFLSAGVPHTGTCTHRHVYMHTHTQGKHRHNYVLALSHLQLALCPCSCRNWKQHHSEWFWNFRPMCHLVTKQVSLKTKLFLPLYLKLKSVTCDEPTWVQKRFVFSCFYFVVQEHSPDSRNWSSIKTCACISIEQMLSLQWTAL